MKTKYFIFAASALVALASCSSDEYVGDNSPTLGQGDGSIQFSYTMPQNATRADHVGADAAGLLNNKFYVVAFNGNGSTMAQTFDNYLVEWEVNTAGKTESNTSDWEYVGKTAPAWSGISGKTQTIKYWDYSKDQYDFIAWSPGSATPVTTSPNAGEIQITKPTPGSYDPTYALTGARNDLAKCYIADMVTAYKAVQTPAQPQYQQEVKLTFRNLACKVRMALYETVPGYSVKDVKFYTAEEATQPIATGASLTNAHLFTTGTADKDNFFTSGTYTVSFPTKGSSNLSNSDYNKAHVAFSGAGKSTNEDFGALNLVGKQQDEEDASNYLGRTLPTASYAGAAAPYYKTMLSNEAGTVLELRVDYTLLAIDGSGEEIHIYGAKAFVPAIYAEWKPNYAYTYIFKISDNTNGWTSQVTTDPQGLYPITFDAVVVDADEYKQSTITTVATPSITTYQKGHNPAEGNAIISLNEYDKDNGDIYIQVMNNGTLAANLTAADISKLYTLNAGTWTEADVMDALNIQAYGSTTDHVIGRNGLELTAASIANNITTIPAVNGNNITIDAGTAAEFAPAAGTYAYVYYTSTDNADTNIYAAVHFAKDASAPADWTGNYWDNPNGIGSAVVTFDSTPAEGVTYYRHYTNLNKVYGVKIIKVVD